MNMKLLRLILVATLVLSDAHEAARLSSEILPSEYRAVSANCATVPLAVNACVPSSVTALIVGAAGVVATVGVAEVGVLGVSLPQALTNARHVTPIAVQMLPASPRPVTLRVP